MGTRRSELTERKPTWRTHVLAITVGVFAFLCSLRFGYAWGGSIAAAVAGLIFPVVAYYGKFGAHRWFWVTVTLLTILQIPLVIAVRPLVEQFRFVCMLVFGVVDFVLVAFILSWVCSKESREPN
jgi:hypothetical protein